MNEVPTIGFGYELSFAPLAEAALLVRAGDGRVIDAEVVDAVVALTHALDRAELKGVVDTVPSYSTILIEFDPLATDGDALEAAIRRIASSGISGPDRDARVVIIPVAYGGEYGPDLLDMASELGLSRDEVIRRHAGGDYKVACMGFSPGWAYLLGLAPELTIPRLENPRTRVPAGSVAVGGAQTGVYPSESPGGWRLIGRTPLKMFDPNRDEPFLLQAGDQVRFAPIDRDRFVALESGDG